MDLGYHGIDMAKDNEAVRITEDRRPWHNVLPTANSWKTA